MKKEFLNFTGASWGEFSNASGQARIPDVVSEEVQGLYDYIYAQFIDMGYSDEETLEYLSPFFGGGSWTTPTYSPDKWIGDTGCSDPNFCVASDIESWQMEYAQGGTQSGSQVTPQMAAEAYHLQYGCMQPNPNLLYNWYTEFLVNTYGVEMIDIMDSYGGGNDYAFIDDMSAAIEVLCENPLGGEPVAPQSETYTEEEFAQAYISANGCGSPYTLVTVDMLVEFAVELVNYSPPSPSSSAASLMQMYFQDVSEIIQNLCFGQPTEPTGGEPQDPDVITPIIETMPPAYPMVAVDFYSVNGCSIDGGVGLNNLTYFLEEMYGFTYPINDNYFDLFMGEYMFLCEQNYDYPIIGCSPLTIEAINIVQNYNPNTINSQSYTESLFRICGIFPIPAEWYEYNEGGLPNWVQDTPSDLINMGYYLDPTQSAFHYQSGCQYDVSLIAQSINNYWNATNSFLQSNMQEEGVQMVLQNFLLPLYALETTAPYTIDSQEIEDAIAQFAHNFFAYVWDFYNMDDGMFNPTGVTFEQASCSSIPQGDLEMFSIFNEVFNWTPPFCDDGCPECPDCGAPTDCPDCNCDCPDPCPQGGGLVGGGVTGARPPRPTDTSKPRPKSRTPRLRNKGKSSFNGIRF